MSGPSASGGGIRRTDFEDVERGPNQAVRPGHHSRMPSFKHPKRDLKTVRDDLTLDLTCGVAEFMGTFMFLFLAFMGTEAVVYNNQTQMNPTDNASVVYIALNFGMSLIVTAWVFFRICGAAFNPAVTFALWLIGNMTYTRALITAFAQLLGGIAAAGVVKGLTRSPLGVANSVLPNLGYGRALAIEMFITSILVFSVLMMASEKHKGTYLAPICIGLSVFIGNLAAVTYTGGGMNPARVLGPFVVTKNFPNASWAYFLGEFLGAVLAVLVYTFMKIIDYEQIVPDVDTAKKADSQDLSKAPLAPAIVEALGPLSPSAERSTPDFSKAEKAE